MATNPQPGFTDDQMQKLFTVVMDQMVQARWLHSYTSTKGKGYHLTWTEAGTQCACLLKKIADSFRLETDDRTPLIFDAIAHGTPPPPGTDFKGELDEDVAAFWRESVAQLKITRDEDHLLTLVQIATGWAPDLDTPVCFGS